MAGDLVCHDCLLRFLVALNAMLTDPNEGLAVIFWTVKVRAALGVSSVAAVVVGAVVTGASVVWASAEVDGVAVSPASDPQPASVATAKIHTQQLRFAPSFLPIAAKTYLRAA